MEVNENTKLSDLLEYRGGIAYVLSEYGMHCLGCHASEYETLGEACAAHAIDVDDVINVINNYIRLYNDKLEEA
ncbi:MAG: DUF1858 domain-containing protein [Eubacterium sp.]|nr:DUF1858 domain-containing protein [Eubacterium sp.]